MATCLRCGNEWTPRKEHPKRCPRCFRSLSEASRSERALKARESYLRMSPERKRDYIEKTKICKSRRTPEQKKSRADANSRWFAALPENRRSELRERYREWHHRNPEMAVIRTHRRRARVKAAAGSYTAVQWGELKGRCGCRCMACGLGEPEITLTVDHIVPISKGGSNAIENIQPLCLPCNLKKGTATVNYLKAAA